MNETTLSTISALPTSRKQIESFVYMLKTEILASKNPLQEFVKLKYAERTFEEILKDSDIKEAVLNEFYLYEKEKIIEILGAKLNLSEVATKYDYAGSGDSVWLNLEKQIAELTEKKKARETLLKALPEEGMVDAQTGLYITRPPKSSETKVIVKFF